MLGVEDIFKRIQSFTSYTWDVKYKQLSPYRCAIHGFINSGPNEIQCEICNEKIKIDTKGDNTFEIEKVLKDVAHYKNLLKTVHVEECFFHNQNHHQKITTEYLYRQWRVHYNGNLYSYSNQESIELPVISTNVKTYIGEKNFDIINFKGSSLEISIVDVPKILSIFGWKYYKGPRSSFIEGEEIKPSLKCDFCGRTALISIYKTQVGRMQNLNETGQITESSEGFVSIFDPLQEHNYYCKWGKPRQSDLGKEYGWSICVEMLRYAALTEGKEQREGRWIEEEGKTQENIEEEKAHASILAEQTRFKLEIMNKLQDLRNLKEKAFKKCEDIIKSSDKLGFKESKKYATMIEDHRTKLDDLIQELNLKVDPEKKVKAQ